MSDEEEVNNIIIVAENNSISTFDINQNQNYYQRYHQQHQHQLRTIIPEYAPIQEYEVNISESDRELDALIFCDAIVACIIDNHSKYGSYICTHCNNVITPTISNITTLPISTISTSPISTILTSPISTSTISSSTISSSSQNEENRIVTFLDVLNHVQGHYRSDGLNGLGGIYTCSTCFQEFRSAQALSNHVNTTHYIDVINDSNYGSDYEDTNNDSDDNNNYDNDNNDNHAYRCPICNRGYNNQEELGNHFIRNHNTYEELGILDKKQCTIFPGYELLNKIGMFSYVKSNNNKKKMDKNKKYMNHEFNIHNDTCVLCCCEYTDFMRPKTDDMLILINSKPYKPSKPSKPSNKINDISLNNKINNISRKQKYQIFYDDTKILYIMDLLYTPKHPLKLKCCGAIMCSDCLKHHVISKLGQPSCPFCRKLHIRNDLRFIIFDERPKEKIMLDPNPYPLNSNIHSNNIYYATYEYSDAYSDEYTDEIEYDSDMIDLEDTSSSEYIDDNNTYDGVITNTDVDINSDISSDISSDTSSDTSSDDDTDIAIDDEMERINTMINNYLNFNYIVTLFTLMMMFI